MRQSQMLTWQEVYRRYQAPYEVICRDTPYQMWVEREHPQPCAAAEITLMLCAVGICGTDLRVYTGERPVPAGRIGHEAFAVVVDVGEQAWEKGYRKGMCVVVDCNHPDPRKRDLHLDGVLGRFYRVPAAFVMSAPQRRIIPLDGALSSGRIAPATAALIEPMTVALHALDYLRRGGPRPREDYDRDLSTTGSAPADEGDGIRGKNLVITGAGSIAVFAACLARILQAKSITLVNRDPGRLAHAARVAKPDYCFADDEHVGAKLLEQFRATGGVDAVLVASHASAVGKAVDYLNPHGTVLLVAGMGKEDVLHTDTGAVDLYPIRHDDLERHVVVHGKPLTIMGAHGTTEPLFHQVVSYLVNGTFEQYGMAPLGQVSHIVSLEAIPQVFALATSGKTIRHATIRKILVDFRLIGQHIYTLEEYTAAFPRESQDFLTGQGVAAIARFDSRRIQAKNAPSAIRAAMDALEGAWEERYQEEPDARAWKFLEMAFLVANDAYSRMHRGRRFRPDGTRFIYHPLEMAAEAMRLLDLVDPEVIAAIVLHDVLEYTPIGASALREQFGETVAAIAGDLAQDRTFERMPLDRVKEYLQGAALVPWLQQVRCAGTEREQRCALLNLAIKNEHYTRLLGAPRHPLSPRLKVLDVLSNYRWVRDLPLPHIPVRSPEELALVRAYITECGKQYALPQELLRAVHDVVALYESAERGRR